MININNLPSELILNIAHKVAIIPNEGSKHIPKLTQQYYNLNSFRATCKIFHKLSLDYTNSSSILVDIDKDIPHNDSRDKFMIAVGRYKNLKFTNYLYSEPPINYLYSEFAELCKIPEINYFNNTQQIIHIINQLEIPVMQHIKYILFNEKSLVPLIIHDYRIWNLTFFNFGLNTIINDNENLSNKGISITLLSSLASTREGRFLLKNHYNEIINFGETRDSYELSQLINKRIASFSKLVKSDEGANLAIDKFDEVILWKDANISLLAHLYSSDKGKIFAQDNFDFIMQLNTRGANNIQMLFIPQLEDLVTAHKDIIINSEVLLIRHLYQLTKSDIGIVLLLNHDFTQILNIPLNQIQSLTNAINNNALNYEQAQLELNKLLTI